MYLIIILLIIIIGLAYLEPRIITIKIKNENLVTLWYTNIFTGLRDYLILWKKD